MSSNLRIDNLKYFVFNLQIIHSNLFDVVVCHFADEIKNLLRLIEKYLRLLIQTFLYDTFIVFIYVFFFKFLLCMYIFCYKFLMANKKCYVRKKYIDKCR